MPSVTVKSMPIDRYIYYIKNGDEITTLIKQDVQFLFVTHTTVLLVAAIFTLYLTVAPEPRINAQAVTASEFLLPAC